MNDDALSHDEFSVMLNTVSRPLCSKRILAVISVIVICLLLVLFFYSSNNNSIVQYQTQSIQKTSFVVSVTATGSIQPMDEVDVGTEVSGTIETVLVDFNDNVQKDQILAQLDKDKLNAQVLQSEAAVELAKSELIEAQANVSEATTDLERLKRVRELSGGKLPSEQELDIAGTALKRAKAKEISAGAQIKQAEAKLSINKTDLEKADIRSPIDGVVLLRQAEPGQTIAASLQTPVLFTIAEDLTKMELHVDVDEADVGQVKDGQFAEFTVDAYPNKTFAAKIIQIRHMSSTTSGVVTYTTVLSLDNSDMLLKPGMTATAAIIVRDAKDVLSIPNAALRYAPPQVESDSTEKKSFLSKLMPRPPFHKRSQRGSAVNGKNGKQVWVLKNGEPKPVIIFTGDSDGRSTEILSGDVLAGDEVIVATINAKN